MLDLVCALLRNLCASFWVYSSGSAFGTIFTCLLVAMLVLDELARAVQARYRRAFAKRGAKRLYRRLALNSARHRLDSEFEAALWQHNCLLACMFVSGNALDEVICSSCRVLIAGVRVSDVRGGFVHWGCAPLEARDSCLGSSELCQVPGCGGRPCWSRRLSGELFLKRRLASCLTACRSQRAPEVFAWQS